MPRLSSLSAESATAIYNTLRQHYETVGITIVNKRSDLDLLISERPDLAFMGLGYIYDDLTNSKIWVSTYLEQHGIRHTGSGRKALEFERNKHLAKQRIIEEGLMTSPYQVIKTNMPYLDTGLLLRFPLFVKPTNMGGGLGVDKNSVVHNFADLRSKTISITENHASDSLIEEYLPGREFSVAILKKENSPDYVAMPIELVTENNSRGDRILSQYVKSSNKETVLAVDDPSTRTKIVNIALGVFNALGAQDYGRIDIRLDAAKLPNFLEANLIPSLIKGYGSFPKACALNIGMSYEEMILQIVRLGLAQTPRADDSETILESTLAPTSASE